MKNKLVIAGFLLGAALAPVAAYSADTMANDSAKARHYVKDSVVTTKVKAKLAEQKVASLVKIQVDTDDQGVVYLSGTTKTQAEADQAVSITRGVQGVTSVHSDLRIGS
jgi:hyperosmotically inducible periplasmic protein